MSSEIESKEELSRYWTKVEISVFKPYGYVYTYYIHTHNRGYAIVRVMKAHKDQLKYVNYVRANLTGAPPVDRNDYRILAVPAKI